MTDNELPEDVGAHVSGAISELVDMAAENAMTLQHATDSGYTNEVCTPRMEEASIGEVFAVIDADDNLDLRDMASAYDDYDSSERAVRHYGALCLQQLVYDRLDVLLGDTDE